jgi:hypothetical protein
MMLLNKKTKILLEAFYARPSGSLILEGTTASGVEQVLTDMCSTLLGREHLGNTLIINEPESESIGIDTIRELKAKMTTVAGGEKEVTRIAVIRQAERLTQQAQNALLKLIEEPVKNTVLILQVSDKSQLISTIQSRCQCIPVLQITEKQAKEYAETISMKAIEMNKAYLLSQGQAKLFMDLINGETSEQVDDTSMAKKYLTDTVFSRLKNSKEYNEKNTLQKLIASLELVAEAGLHSSTSATSARWQHTLKEVREAKELLKSNANVKLVLLRLSIMV